jgi:hypothetical protein
LPFCFGGLSEGPLRLEFEHSYSASTNLSRITYLNKKFWEELITYFPLIRHGPQRKRRLQQFFVVSRTSLPSCYLATIGDTQTNRHTPSIILLLLRVFIATGTCSLIRLLEMKQGIQFTEPLLTNDRRDTNTDTQTDGRDL